MRRRKDVLLAAVLPRDVFTIVNAVRGTLAKAQGLKMPDMVIRITNKDHFSQCRYNKVYRSNIDRDNHVCPSAV